MKLYVFYLRCGCVHVCAWVCVMGTGGWEGRGGERHLCHVLFLVTSRFSYWDGLCETRTFSTSHHYFTTRQLSQRCASTTRLGLRRPFVKPGDAGAPGRKPCPCPALCRTDVRAVACHTEERGQWPEVCGEFAEGNVNLGKLNSSLFYANWENYYCSLTEKY